MRVSFSRESFHAHDERVHGAGIFRPQPHLEYVAHQLPFGDDVVFNVLQERNFFSMPASADNLGFQGIKFEVVMVRSVSQRGASDRDSPKFLVGGPGILSLQCARGIGEPAFCGERLLSNSTR